MFQYFLIMHYLFILLTAVAAGNAPLTPAEKAIAKTQKNTSIHFGQKTGSILENIDGGRIIVLDDGTKWLVDPVDTQFTGGWLGPAPVVIRKDRPEQEEYNYSMTNKWTDKTVRVQKWNAGSNGASTSQAEMKS